LCTLASEGKGNSYAIFTVEHSLGSGHWIDRLEHLRIVEKRTVGFTGSRAKQLSAAACPEANSGGGEDDYEHGYDRHQESV
jgi:hypothetical protein